MLGFVLFVFTLIVNIARLHDRESLPERQGGRAVTSDDGTDSDQRERRCDFDSARRRRDPAEFPPRRRTRDFGAQGLVLLVGSALSAFAIVWIFFYQLTLLSGAFGFIVCWYASSSSSTGS